MAEVLSPATFPYPLPLSAPFPSQQGRSMRKHAQHRQRRPAGRQRPPSLHTVAAVPIDRPTQADAPRVAANRLARRLGAPQAAWRKAAPHHCKWCTATQKDTASAVRTTRSLAAPRRAAPAPCRAAPRHLTQGTSGERRSNGCAKGRQGGTVAAGRATVL